MSNNYMNRQYFDDLEKFSPEEIVEILTLEKMFDIVFKPDTEIINLLTFSGFTFSEMKILLSARLRTRTKKDKQIKDLLIRFLRTLEVSSAHGSENINFVKNPDHYEKL